MTFQNTRFMSAIIDSIIIAIVIVILGLCLPSCDTSNGVTKKFTHAQPTAAVGGDVEYHIIMSSIASAVEYRIVIIDGEEYLATESYRGYWSLCPKIKTKKTEAIQ